MSKERITKITISLLLLLSIVIGVSYAFLQSNLEDEESVDISVQAKTIDVLTFNVADDFKIDVTPETFPENGDDINQTFIATASLIANNSTNKAKYNYYLYLLIHDNTLEYTQSPDVPELLLNVSGPDETEVTTISNLEKKSVKGLNGFDITKANGLYLINSSDMEITSSSSILATDETWTFSITLVNLDTNQVANSSNSFSASIIMRSEPIDEENIANVCKGDELANCIKDNYKLDSSIIYHDGKQDNPEEENYTLEAGDLSYRYHGANPNNYVCFGSECSIDPENPGYKNLYRIIGLFKNDSDEYEAKIIKADAATKEDLGDELAIENSAYYGNYGYDKANYKGKLTTFASYYWNSTNGTNSSSNNVNMWAASNLNTKNLNETYYNAIEEPYKSMVVEHEWQVGGYTNSNVDARRIYNIELGTEKLTSSSKNCYDQGNPSSPRECSGQNDLTYNAHVGLMYLSDYMYGTLPKYWPTNASGHSGDDIKDNDWLYLGITEWTISRSSMEGDIARCLSTTGDVFSYPTYNVYSGRGIRPVVYLSSGVKITGGSGTETDPFKLEI